MNIRCFFKREPQLCMSILVYIRHLLQFLVDECNKVVDISRPLFLSRLFWTRFSIALVVLRRTRGRAAATSRATTAAVAPGQFSSGEGNTIFAIQREQWANYCNILHPIPPWNNVIVEVGRLFTLMYQKRM